MKDLPKDQQWWVERGSNLIPPQYRPNALTTTPCSPTWAFYGLFILKWIDLEISQRTMHFDWRNLFCITLKIAGHKKQPGSILQLFKFYFVSFSQETKSITFSTAMFNFFLRVLLTATRRVSLGLVVNAELYDLWLKAGDRVWALFRVQLWTKVFFMLANVEGSCPVPIRSFCGFLWLF